MQFLDYILYRIAMFQNIFLSNDDVALELPFRYQMFKWLICWSLLIVQLKCNAICFSLQSLRLSLLAEIYGSSGERLE